MRERLQAILKSYVKERKAEVKRRGKTETKAAESAVASYLFLDGAKSLSKRAVLLDLLVDEKAMLPADKKLGSTMSGAFLIWTPFLIALCKATSPFLHALLERVVEVLSAAAAAAATVPVEEDPTREGLYEWCTHILTSSEWKNIRERTHTQSSSSNGTYPQSRLVEHVLALCFTTPTFWPLKLADALLRDEKLAARESWVAILEAARSEDSDVDMEENVLTESVDTVSPSVPTTKEVDKVEVPKMRGPQKRVGLWRPVPIGTLVGGD